ncbi:MAG TPA: peptidylprolyl isomerase [Planktothrix sp.]
MPTITEKRCPFCAETIKSAAIKCKHCGADLQPESASTTSPTPTEDKSIKRSVNVTTVIIGLGLLLWWACLQLSQQQQHTPQNTGRTTAETSPSSNKLEVGQELVVKLNFDKTFPLFTDLGAYSAWVEAMNANDERGEIELKNAGRLYCLPEQATDIYNWNTKSTRMLVLQDDMLALDHGILTKVRVFKDEYSGKSLKGWVITSLLKERLPNSSPKPPVAAPASTATHPLPSYKIRHASDPIVDIKTDKGEIRIEIFKSEAPRTAANFLDLTHKGFYNGLTFHRVESWVVQGGDPTGTGTGDYIDPKTNVKRLIKLEVSPTLKHDLAGTVAMARSPDPDSASCQFYITKKPAEFLDMHYAVFGHVLSGMDVVNNLEEGDRMSKVFQLAPSKH